MAGLTGRSAHGLRKRAAVRCVPIGKALGGVLLAGPRRWFTETSPDGSVAQIQKLVFTEKKGRERKVKRHELPILLPLRRSYSSRLEPARQPEAVAAGFPSELERRKIVRKKVAQLYGVDLD